MFCKSVAQVKHFLNTRQSVPRDFTTTNMLLCCYKYINIHKNNKHLNYPHKYELLYNSNIYLIGVNLISNYLNYKS